MEKEKTENRSAHVLAWAIWAIPFTAVAYFAGQFIGAIPFVLYVIVTGQTDGQLTALENSVIGQSLFVVSVEVATIGLLYVAMRILRVTRRAIGLIRPKIHDLAYALAGYAGYFTLYYIIVIIVGLIAQSINLDQEQSLGFDPVTVQGLSLLPVFMSLVVLPALVEEIAVRGFLFSGLRTKLGFVLSAVITSSLFALAHLQWGNDAPLLWIAAIDTFILSLFLCYLREKTGRLAAPIVLHGIKNFVAFTVLFIFKLG